MPGGTIRIRLAKIFWSRTGSYLVYESEIREGNQHEFNKPKSKFYPKAESRGQSATYAAALTTPQGVTSEQPNTVTTSQPPRDPSSTPRQKVGRQLATYAAALTTPQVVTSEQPNIAATSQPSRASAASPDMTSSMQTGC